jgi:hypothetical protein
MLTSNQEIIRTKEVFLNEFKCGDTYYHTVTTGGKPDYIEELRLLNFSPKGFECILSYNNNEYRQFRLFEDMFNDEYKVIVQSKDLAMKLMAQFLQEFNSNSDKILAFEESESSFREYVRSTKN